VEFADGSTAVRQSSTEDAMQLPPTPACVNRLALDLQQVAGWAVFGRLRPPQTGVVQPEGPATWRHGPPLSIPSWRAGRGGVGTCRGPAGSILPANGAGNLSQRSPVWHHRRRVDGLWFRPDFGPTSLKTPVEDAFCIDRLGGGPCWSRWLGELAHGDLDFSSSWVTQSGPSASDSGLTAGSSQPKAELALAGAAVTGHSAPVC